MIWHSLVARLPPLRVFVGAGVALASYFVTSDWKAGIDEQLRKYSEFVNATITTETRLADFRMFQTAVRSWGESIELQKLQASLIYGLSHKDKLDNVQLADSDNSNLLRAINGEQTALIRFFRSLPKEVVERRPNPDVDDLNPAKQHNNTASVAGCITTDVYKNPEFGQAYSEALADLYKQEAANLPNLEQYPVSLGDAVDKQFARLTIGYATAMAVGKSDPLTLISTTNEIEQQTYLGRKRWAQNCLTMAMDWSFDYLAILLSQTRAVISEKFIEPLNKSKRRVEMLETVLYVASALIALYGQAGRPGNPAPDSEATANGAVSARRPKVNEA